MPGLNWSGRVDKNRLSYYNDQVSERMNNLIGFNSNINATLTSNYLNITIFSFGNDNFKPCTFSLLSGFSD